MDKLKIYSVIIQYSFTFEFIREKSFFFFFGRIVQQLGRKVHQPGRNVRRKKIKILKKKKKTPFRPKFGLAGTSGQKKSWPERPVFNII